MLMAIELRNQTKRVPLFPFISLLCFVCLFLALSLSRRASSPIIFTSQFRFVHPSNMSPLIPDSCDLSQGSWVFDALSVPSYDESCKEIYKGWNCALGGKSNAKEIPNWRWSPDGDNCQLPRFDPYVFLETYRDTSIGFVGDSLTRNMFVSLFCTLKRASGESKKWRPAKADRGFTFTSYNLTIAYHRTNLLSRYGRWQGDDSNGALEKLGFKEGYRIDVDVADSSWAEAPSFHNVLIFNTGHWWGARSKFDPVKSPMLFFEKGQPLIPPLSPFAGLERALKNMILFAEKNVKPNGVLFFRTHSPRHFEGGDWDEGGSCRRLQPLAYHQVNEVYPIEKNGTNEVNEVLRKALKGSKFRVLEITKMSEGRADGHPSIAGGKKHEDCMHWCLPGLPDTWNDLFVFYLGRTQISN